jgi:putative transposase
MTTTRRGGFLGCGDRVRFRGDNFTVLRVSGTLVVLADESLQAPGQAVRLSELQSDPDFAVLGAAPSMPVPATSRLEGLAKDVMLEARWWERHVLEVIRGVAPDDPAAAGPKPQYDLTLTTMVARERAKADELTASGYLTSASTVRRQRQRYEAHGLVGLVDSRRRARHPSTASRADQKVIAALRAAIDETVDASTRTVSYLIWRAGQLLVQEHGDQAPPMPPRATCYRLVAQLSDKHTTGSARTRRSLAGQPDKPFSHLPVDAPGEVVQIDTTPLDVLVLLPNGIVGRAELTGMIDVATRTVPAAVLTPTTKAVDASVLLARSVTPEPMRPGWVDALRMAYSVLPHRRLLAIDERLEHAAARPVIIPDTIVCDHGKVFISSNFRSSCRFLGISFQPTHPAFGANKPHVERMFSSVGTLFAQFVSGFVGRSAEHRGFRVDQQPLWTLLELQALLDEWLIAGWQNRPHDGLRDPQTPGRAFTPNEKYAALVEAAGYVPVAMTADDYVELLPATWRTVNTGGLKINNRTYDAHVLNPIRRQPSGITSRHNLWEVHYDPYDVAHVWVRDHRPDSPSRWLQATWKHLSRAPIPFGELAWNHVRAGLGPKPDETAVADAVQRLLTRANTGPPQPTLSTRDRRVAARTAATSENRPVPRQQPPAQQPETDEPQAGTVIPLRVFDPAEEARRPW